MTLIADTPALSAVCNRFASAEFITVDTEFLRESTFWPKLCLIQMADAEETAIVDVLAPGMDLAPFFDLMRNEKVLKVFHAGRQDIEIVWHLGGFIPHPVFDTQIAAMVCGFGESVSYEQLVGRITGASIDKSQRFTDWSRRPLSAHQIDYARADVTHLREVYAYLRDTLERQDRAGWLAEEMETLTSERTYRTEPEDAWQRLKLRVRKPRDLAVLMELAAWRERTAQSRDVPRSRVIKDEAIYEIAAQHPTDAEALGRLRTIPRGFERSRSGEEIIAAVERAMAVPKDKLPLLPKSRQVPEGAAAAVDLLKVLLKLVCDEHGVATKIVANTDDLERIAAEGAKADVAAMHGWRRELFGDRALDLVAGHLALTFAGGKVRALDADAAEEAVSRGKARAAAI